jgi:hypothetical protein
MPLGDEPSMEELLGDDFDVEALGDKGDELE